MPRTPDFRLFLAAGLAGLIAACSGGGAAGDSAAKPDEAASATAAPVADAATVIKERQENFKAIGGAFKAIRGELDKDVPDYALIGTKAADINSRAGVIATHFPTGTGPAEGLKTEALPAIWEKPDAFKAAAQKLVDESGTLVTRAGEGDKAAVAKQAMAMGGTCKGCHDQFRLDDEKK